MALIGAIVTTDRFSWDKGVGVTELSNFKGFENLLFGRLYDDACDIGFRILNPKTNVCEAFYFEREDKDSIEGEVLGFYFKPINLKLRDAGVRILVVND